MTIYQAPQRRFIPDNVQNDIEDRPAQQCLRNTGKTASSSEFKAWQNSRFTVGMVLHASILQDDIGVELEYTVPQTSKRIDVLPTAEDEQGTPKLLIIELSQWFESRLSEKDGIICARRRGKAGDMEGSDLSYQKSLYVGLLSDFNHAVNEGGVALQPCAYLHNSPRAMI